MLIKFQGRSLPKEFFTLLACHHYYLYFTDQILQYEKYDGSPAIRFRKFAHKEKNLNIANLALLTTSFSWISSSKISSPVNPQSVSPDISISLHCIVFLFHRRVATINLPLLQPSKSFMRFVKLTKKNIFPISFL